jgi:hypothetical protein
MLEEANEVQDVLGRSYGMPEIDEDELEGQLDALLDDMALVTTSSFVFFLITSFLHYNWFSLITNLIKLTLRLV